MNPGIEPSLAYGIVLSDSVIVERGTNKHTLIGTFSRFTLPKFPFQIPIFFVTFGITNIHGKIDEMSVTVRIQDPQSAHVFHSTSATIQRPPDAPPVEPNEVLELALPCQGIVFQQAGTYQVEVLVDSEQVAVRPLTVVAVNRAA